MDLFLNDVYGDDILSRLNLKYFYYFTCSLGLIISNFRLVISSIPKSVVVKAQSITYNTKLQIII